MAAKKRGGGRPSSFSDETLIKQALAPFVKGVFFCNYTCDRDVGSMDTDILSTNRYLSLLRRMSVLSKSLSFRPASITACLIDISKASGSASPHPK